MLTEELIIVRGLYFKNTEQMDAVAFQNAVILKATQFLADVRRILGISSYVITDFENRLEESNEMFVAYRLLANVCTVNKLQDLERISNAVDHTIERWFPEEAGVIPTEFDAFFVRKIEQLQVFYAN